MSDALDIMALVPLGVELTMRQKVFALEDHIRRELKPVECPVTHYFSEGLYARAMFIPADTVVTGKIHKYASLMIMSKGEASIITENGPLRIKAPFTHVSPPGTKRCVYAHEDCVFTTIHATRETDVTKIEAEFIAQTEQDYLTFCAQQLEVKS